MATLASLNLSVKQRKAIEILKERLVSNFSVDELIMFGSVARDEARPDSDLDILVITTHVLNDAEYDAVCRETYAVNLLYETEIAPVITDAYSWRFGVLSATVFHGDVLRDGIAI